MARTQLKILVFLIALGIMLGCVAAAYYVYAKILKPGRQIEAELANLRGAQIKRIDPGEKRFEAALQQLRAGQMDQAREALYRLLQQFPQSKHATESRRIIGEINLDELFSPSQRAGKIQYIVQPGDSLALIANRQSTSMDMIIRLNGLMNSTLQPGDHLTLVQLDFTLQADLSNQRLTLRRRAADKEFFFKDYAAKIRLPPGLRAPAEMEIRGKSALASGQAVLAGSASYLAAEKIMPTSKGGLVIRGPRPVVATASAAGAQSVDPARTPPTPSPPQAAPAPPAAPDLAEPGIFLAREDLEELFALVRNGSKLYLIR